MEFLREWWALNHAFERTSKRLHARLGVTGQQRVVIRLVGAQPGISPGELARLLHVDAGTVSATLRRLEAQGVLERRPAASDRRRVSLHLTPAGARYDHPDAGSIEGALERLLAKVPAEDVGVVRSFVAGFVRELDGIAPTAAAPTDIR